MITCTFIFFILFCFTTRAQLSTTISGRLSTDAGQPLSGATISAQGRGVATQSGEDGNFSLTIPHKTAVRAVLAISHVGYQLRTVPVLLKGRPIRLDSIRLDVAVRELSEVSIRGLAREREQSSLTTLDPKIATVLPTPFGDFNKILATLPGVVTTSELSSQYSVRGGNYDENLVYVNDMEVYRPTLVRSGQQEGLSFVNPDLVRQADFSSGGWQPRYGDRLSSVLAVRYKEPRAIHASISAGILTQTAHLELGSKKSRWSFIGGVRRKSTQYLLSKSFLTRGFDVQGTYLPRFADGQGLITYRIRDYDSTKTVHELKVGILSNFASNRYLVIPEEQETQFGNTQAVLRLDVAFIGRELLTYNTWQTGLQLQSVIGKVKSDLTIAYIKSYERERNDVEGGYRLCDVQNDPGKDRFNQCITLRGVGTFYNYARNELDVDIVQATSRNYYQYGQLVNLEGGFTIQHEQVRDKIYQYSFVDSADYVKVDTPLISSLGISSYRPQAYIQNTFRLGNTTITAGVRGQYWTLNKQTLISPRIQLSHRLLDDGRWVLKFAAGVYNQSPFYRELRDYKGRLFTDLKAQRSTHFVAGSDLGLKMWNRPFRFIAEAYYKDVSRIIPYDVDNVRIRYLPNYGGKAYAYGLDMRLAGEFIKGTESWFSLGILNTREQVFANPGDTGNARPKDGYIRRPTDQRVTLGIFFQDQLPNHPSYKVYVNTVIGTGLPFGPPNAVRYRSALSGPAYRRVDIGFSKVIALADKSTRVGRYFETISLGLDILNLIGINNTISYLWIKDVNNTQFAIPNYLSARFFNLKARVDF